MLVRAEKTQPIAAEQLVLKIRCPGCSSFGTFDKVLASDVNVMGTHMVLGTRCCPNPDCYAVVFFVADRGRALVTYPSQRIDFDVENVPDSVRAAMDEAITCHASNCHVASAIMVRKALELICADRGATGVNLKERLANLGTRIVLPTELLEGMDDLRLLGNDAVHVESKIFAQVGTDEAVIGIEFAKEIIKATYQYTNLLDKLRSLKKLA